MLVATSQKPNTRDTTMMTWSVRAPMPLGDYVVAGREGCADVVIDAPLVPGLRRSCVRLQLGFLQLGPGAGSGHHADAGVHRVVAAGICTRVSVAAMPNI